MKESVPKAVVHGGNEWYVLSPENDNLFNHNNNNNNNNNNIHTYIVYHCFIIQIYNSAISFLFFPYFILLRIMDSLTEAQIEEMKDVFSVMDENKNGSIDINELAKGLRGLGLNPSNTEVEALMQAVDKDNNQVISLDEFALLYAKCLESGGPSKDEINEQFSKLDTNGDGTVDIFELRKIMLYGDDRLSEEDAEKIIRDFDRNGDGRISLREFIEGVLGKP